MPAREVIEAWESIIDECAELYEQVRATVADLPEIKNVEVWVDEDVCDYQDEREEAAVAG